MSKKRRERRKRLAEHVANGTYQPRVVIKDRNAECRADLRTNSAIFAKRTVL